MRQVHALHANTMGRPCHHAVKYLKSIRLTPHGSIIVLKQGSTATLTKTRGDIYLFIDDADIVRNMSFGEEEPPTITHGGIYMACPTPPPLE